MTRHRFAATLLVLGLAAAACGGSEPSSSAGASPAGPASAAASPSPPEPTAVAPGTVEPATQPPAATGPPAATDDPGTSGPPAGTEDPATSSEPGSADACTGNDANREFFATLAPKVDWPVLCAVLPKHWFVSTGSYRLANGGKLLMSYKGPGDATLALSEGAFCSDAGGCVPPGTEAGDAALGPLSGTLVALDDGGWAIVVDRGADVSWLLEAHGLDEAATTSLGAALVEVEG